MNLQSAKINPKMINDTTVTRNGSFIVKCHTDIETRTVESVLKENNRIKRFATIKKAGPKFVNFVIKNIPQQIQEQVLSSSLVNHFGAENFQLGRYFPYKKSDAFTQVVRAREDLVTSLLSHPAPKMQVGNVFYDVDVYVPTTRCFKCQDFGHSMNQCKQTSSYCAVCAKRGHESKDCTVTSNQTNKHRCINCLTSNGNNNGDQPPLDTQHPAFSSHCQLYKDYFNNSYALLKSKYSQPSPNTAQLVTASSA